MTQMYDKGIFLLRVLHDLVAYSPEQANLSEVFRRTGWSAKEYGQVDKYLSKQGWIEGDLFVYEGWVDPNGWRSITHLGANALAGAIASRMPLSLLAERVALWLDEHDPLGKGVSDSAVTEALGISKESYELAARELLDLGLMEEPTSRTLRSSIVPYPKLTEAGRLAVKNGFVQRENLPISQQIGVQINAPVNQSPIAGIVASEDVTVSQAVESADHEKLLEIGAAYLDRIVDLVKDDLQGGQLASYVQAVQELKSALADKDPDNCKLRKLLSIVAFLDNANGAVELGEKGWQLVKVVLPYIPILVQVITRIATSF
jgi:hypothetical protein